MMFFLLMFLSINAVDTFAQMDDNLTTFVSEDFIGVQVNPILTGVKSSVKNQETEFNITLFYHDKYDLDDHEILGMIEGRLISETSLTSFDLVEQFEKDQESILTNLANQQDAYLEYLRQFQNFQQMRESNALNTLSRTNARKRRTKTLNTRTNTNTTTNTNTNTTNVLTNTSTTNTNTTSTNDGVAYLNQKFVAQSIHNDTVNITELISDKELEQLIYIEKLKEEYQKLVNQYNALLLLQQQQQNQDVFDPADPTERFTIIISGLDDMSSIWTKSFSLDGVDNYQSYNKTVWFLGYKLLITKKDVRLLYEVFSKNNRIQYSISSSKGKLDFQLSPSFVDATKDLMQLFVRGKLKKESTINFPLLRE